MLVDTIEIVGEDEKLARMSSYFTNTTTNLKLKPTKIDPKVNLENF